MRFYGREQELETLRNIERISKQSSQFTVILGRRRIGKTTLMLKATENVKRVYLFITRVDEQLLCTNLKRSAEEAGIMMPNGIAKIGDMLAFLMLYSRLEPLTVILDEFQELGNIDESIYGDIQKAWDLNKEKAHMNLIVSGSVHSMMIRTFDDAREPLYGRSTHRIELRPFKIDTVTEILRDHDPTCTREDILMLHLIAGGVPNYIEVLMDFGATNKESMLDAVTAPGSMFLRDGKDLTRSEFGKDNKVYLSILQLIASGIGQRPRLEDVLGTSLGEYLRRLEEEHGFIRRRTPMFTDDNRMTRWVISDRYLEFYFRYIQPNETYIESGRIDSLRKVILNDLESYEGKVLEDYFLRRISENDEYTDIGGYWNRKGDVEIDMIVLDSFSKKARVIEVKRNREKLDMRALERKSEAIAGYLKGYTIDFEGMSMDDI